MVFDKTRPAGSRKIRLSDDDLRENNAALESALSEGHEFTTGGNQTGKHTTPTFKDNGSDPAAPATANEVVLYNNGGKMYFRTSSSTKFEVGAIPSGTKMLFKQGSAPTGWTFASEDNDKVLINTGVESSGGDIGGAWTISGLSGTVEEHTLTISEMPHHRHLAGLVNGDDKLFVYGGTSEDAPGAAHNDIDQRSETVDRQPYTSFSGGGNSHNHGASVSHDGSWRPAHVKVITCSKD